MRKFRILGIATSLLALTLPVTGCRTAMERTTADVSGRDAIPAASEGTVESPSTGAVRALSSETKAAAVLPTAFEEADTTTLLPAPAESAAPASLVEASGVTLLDLAAIEAEWGIRPLHTRLTAAGFMIDFRYRVTDPKKASLLFDRDAKPRLVQQKSGKTVLVPRTGKIGPLRNSDEPLMGRTFFILFHNPQRFIQRGDKVSVEVGDFYVEDLTVE